MGDASSATLSNYGGALYIVTLRNEHPISVNAHDARVASRSMSVTRENCKVGKARSLERRKENYDKTFGSENVCFCPIVEVDDLDRAERVVLAKVKRFRVIGNSGRRNEWLAGLEASMLERMILEALDQEGLRYSIIGSTLSAVRSA